MLRLSLHPRGLAPRIANLGRWRGHLLEQLDRRIDRTADPRLVELAAELAGYPGGEAAPASPTDVVLPLRLASPAGELSFFSIAAHVGTATDVTVEELTLEAFYPADEATAAVMRGLTPGKVADRRRMVHAPPMSRRATGLVGSLRLPLRWFWSSR